MTISYPVSLPTSIGMESIELSAENASVITSSPFTGDQQVLKYAKEQWSASVVIPALHREYSEPWVAFLLSLRGAFGTFYLGDPLCTTPRGTARDTDALVLTSNVSTGSSISIDSNQASKTGYLKAGDYLQVATQLFKILQDVDTDGAGECTVDVWPRVRTSLTTSSTVKVQDTKGIFRLDGNSQGWSIDNSNKYTLSFDAKESF